MLWFTLWFMVILKIPAVFLCYVIWWAVKDPPAEAAAGGLSEGLDGSGGSPLVNHRPRLPAPGRRPRPHGSPVRRHARTAPVPVRTKRRV